MCAACIPWECAPNSHGPRKPGGFGPQTRKSHYPERAIGIFKANLIIDSARRGKKLPLSGQKLEFQVKNRISKSDRLLGL